MKSMSSFTSKIDYSVESKHERVKLLKSILYTQNGFLDKYFENLFNQNTPYPRFKVNLNREDNLSEDNYMSKQIEYMTNYLLFCKDTLEDNKISKYPYLNSNNKLQIYRRERSLDDMSKKKDKHGLGLIQKYQSSEGEKPKQSIDEDDMKIKPIKEIQRVINHLRVELTKEESSYMRNKIRTHLKKLRKEQVEIKNAIKRPIEFAHVLPNSTKFNYDSDTGYYKKDDKYKYVSFNRIDLGNPKHVYNLLKYYSSLKESTYCNLESDMKHILFDLEDLIDITDLKQYEKDILILKIDGLLVEEIVDTLNKKYRDIKFNNYKVTITWSNIIPNKISKKYKEQYSKWFYTYKAKGEYKQCNKCKKNYLKSRRYFSPKKDGKDGFQAFCKECDAKRKRA